MFKFRTRLLAGCLAMAAFTPAANAQWLARMFDPCNTCAAPPPMVATNCCAPCMQAIPQTVYRDVPVTEYRAVQRTEKRPKVVTAMEERPVTVYRTVMEPQTREIQTVQYQTVNDCQQQCVNRSRWQTTMQPVAKMAPCQYDSRPGLLGSMNRWGYQARMAFTPNAIARREFVPDVQMVNVPVQRTVAVPTTQQVTYNVARLVAEQTTQKVMVSRVEYVDTEVTAYEPFTTTRRMAVGTSYQYAYADFGLGGAAATATAAAPTPADAPTKSAEGSDETFKALSHPLHQKKAEPQPTVAEPTGPVASAPASTPSVVRVVGWRPARKAAEPTPAPAIVANK